MFMSKIKPMVQPVIGTIEQLGQYVTRDNREQIIAELDSFLEVQVVLKEHGFTPMHKYFPGQNKPPKPVEGLLRFGDGAETTTIPDNLF
jgi:hypothetical protein